MFCGLSRGVDVAIATELYLGRLIDLQSKTVRTAESLVRKGDWVFVQLSNYTEGSPLSIANGVTTKVTYQPEDISYTTGKGLSPVYDFENQVFLPSTLNDLFTVEVRFKFKATSPDGHFDVKLESPSFAFNPISGNTVSSTKAAGVEQFAAINLNFFIGQDLIDNGIEFKITPSSTGVEIYDVSYLLVRLSSGK